MQSIKVKILAIMCVISMSFSPISFAHGGRTDSNGGHKDNKNVSGLGGYHYHHGYPAHLHPNGVCPYSTVGENKSTTTDAKSTQKVKEPEIVATDIRTWINGSEIPTFAYTGENSCAVIIAEDLQCYGFDVTWNGNSNILSITKNSSKSLAPIPMDYYRGLSVNSHCYDIHGSAKVVLNYGNASYSPSLVYRLNGYIAISVDELKCFGELKWDGENRRVLINS